MWTSSLKGVDVRVMFCLLQISSARMNTRSLVDFNFHDRPAVKVNQHPLWYLMSVQYGTSKFTWLC